jgi:hypothetical protein
MHVFHHDDGVVDHQADGEHQRQQRQEIDGVAERQHHEERPDQRQRHRDHGDGDRARRPQEKENNHGDDQQRLGERAHHLVDRAVHVLRGIVDDFSVEPFGQLRLDRRKRLAHLVDDRQEVGARRHFDADVDRFLPVEGDRRVVVFRAQRHLGDIAQVHDRAVLRLDDQVAELVDGMQSGGRGEIDGHHLALGTPDRGDEVVRRQGVIDVGGGQAVGRQLLRIQPGAQGELAHAEDLGGLHPLHRL